MTLQDAARSMVKVATPKQEGFIVKTLVKKLPPAMLLFAAHKEVRVHVLRPGEKFRDACPGWYSFFKAGYDKLAAEHLVDISSVVVPGTSRPLIEEPPTLCGITWQADNTVIIRARCLNTPVLIHEFGHIFDDICGRPIPPEMVADAPPGIKQEPMSMYVPGIKEDFARATVKAIFNGGKPWEVFPTPEAAENEHELFAEAFRGWYDGNFGMFELSPMRLPRHAVSEDGKRHIMTDDNHKPIKRSYVKKMYPKIADLLEKMEHKVAAWERRSLRQLRQA